MGPLIVVLQHPRVDVIGIIHWIVGGSPSIMTAGVIDGKLCLWVDIGVVVDSRRQVSQNPLIICHLRVPTLRETEVHCGIIIVVKEPKRHISFS